MKLDSEKTHIIHITLGVGAAIVAIVKYATCSGASHLDPTYALFASALLGLGIANDYFNTPPKAGGE